MKIEFVWIPGGCFNMGKPSGEESAYLEHEVCVDGFWLGKHEVTQAQWEKLMKHNPSRFKKRSSLFDKRGSYPVENVTWHDSKEFIRKLNKIHQGAYEFRLPTEAEWEYACRAGTQSISFWGEDASRACEFANITDKAAQKTFAIGGLGVHNCDDGYTYTSPGGSYRPNGFELYDMLGNVWEWCEDVYSDNAYSMHQHDNPINLDGTSERVVRGASWATIRGEVGCANREHHTPDYKFYDTGFRLVKLP
ncbi:MAG: formylglycine-generating enzyme family protein [Desulfobacteraceae bacterium]|jgi:formylglycine-generating enzyme required for sulfatase activity